MNIQIKKRLMIERQSLISRGYIKEINIILKLPHDLQYIIILYLTSSVFSYVKYKVRCSLFILNPNIYGDSFLFQKMNSLMLNTFLSNFKGKKYEKIQYATKDIEHRPKSISKICYEDEEHFELSKPIQKLPKRLFLTAESRLKMKQKHVKSSIKIRKDEISKKNKYFRTKIEPIKFKGTERDAQYMTFHEDLMESYLMESYLYGYDSDDDDDYYDDDNDTYSYSSYSTYYY